MFNAFELVMLLVSMFSLVTEEKQKTMWFLLEIVFSYDLTTERFPMTRQRYEAVLQLIGPLSELAACRGMVRNNAAEPTFMEAYGILCVILKPILGSLTVAELEEIHLSADEAFQVLFKPLDGLKSAAKSWGRRPINDERFSLWTGACDTDILDAFSPKTNSISAPPADIHPESYKVCSTQVSWSSNITMDDRTAAAILSFGGPLTRMSPQHNEHVKNLETNASQSTMESTAPVLDNCLSAHQFKTSERAINDNPLHKTRVADTSPEAWWTTATLPSGELKSGIPQVPGISPYGIRQTTDIHHPYLPVAPVTIPADRVQDTFPVTSDPTPAPSDMPNYPTLPLHIIKRKPGISNLHTVATTSSPRINMARSVAQDDFMQRQAFKAMHPNEPSVRSNSLEPHTAPNEARWIIPIHANTSVHVPPDYEGYGDTPYGADIYHVLESLSLVVPSTSIVTSSPDSYPCAQRSAGPNDAWWTTSGSTRATFQAHTSDNLPRHGQVYEIVPDHVLESLSLLAPSTASLSPSTPATSLPPTPLRTPQCSADDLPFSGWAAKWESDQHSLWPSALKDERRQFNEEATRPPRTKMTTKKTKSFRQRLGALWSH